jgi:hypothetical protein
MQFHRVAAHVLILPILCMPAPAQADPVVVTEGVLRLDTSDPSLFSFTTPGFSISAVGSYNGPDFAPFRDCFLGSCSAGSPLDPGAQITDPVTSEFFPGVILNGVEHPDAVVDGHILISGPTGVVPEISDMGPDVGRFHGLILEASLTVYRDASRSGAPLLAAELFGRGFLTARFENFEPPPGRIRALDLTYRFGGDTNPVPEPGTLVLLASGAVCLFRRRLARRR